MKKAILAVLVAAAVSFLGVPESSALNFSLDCINYDDSKFLNSSALLLANKTLDIDENDIAFPPYNAGFDLAIPATGDRRGPFND